MALRPHTKVVQQFSSEGYSLVAPEVQAGKPHDFSSDVWQLGQLFYQLATVPKSRGQLPTALTDDDNQTDHQWLPWVSEQVKLIMQCMVSSVPKDRPSVQQVLSDPWFKLR